MRAVWAWFASSVSVSLDEGPIRAAGVTRIEMLIHGTSNKHMLPLHSLLAPGRPTWSTSGAMMTSHIVLQTSTNSALKKADVFSLSRVACALL